MPTEPIPPIRHTSGPGGLLQSSAELVVPAGADWQRGVNFSASCGGSVGVWAACPPSDDKTAAAAGSNVSFGTFQLYAEVECEGGFGRAQIEELADLDLQKGSSAALARELAGNISGNGNPSLQSSAIDRTSLAGPQSLSNSLQALLGAQCECEIGDLMIHAPVWTLPEWLKNDLVEWDGTRYRLGAYVVSFDCYPNIGPDDAEGDTPLPGSGDVWLYVSGTVETRLDTVTKFTDIEERLNITTAMVERLALLRFDPCCVRAVKAKVC